HIMEVWDASFSPDGKLVATASMDDTARIWDFRSGRLLKTLPGHRQGAAAVAFSPDSKTLAVLSLDTQQQVIKLWNLPTDREVADLRVNKRVESLLFSPNGHTLVAWSTGNPDVEFWQSAAGNRTGTAAADRGLR